MENGPNDREVRVFLLYILFFIFYITSRLHHTHHTPLWRGQQPQKPTKAPAANKGQRRPTKREKGPNDARRVVWAIGKFFFKCIFSKCTTYPRKPTKAHSSQQRPTQAHEEGKGPKRWRGTFFFYCTFYFLYYQPAAPHPPHPSLAWTTATKAHKGPSSQRRLTQAHEEGKRPICMFFFNNVFFLKFTTYSRKHTEAHSNQRSSTQAHKGPQQPTKADTGPQRWKTAHMYVFFNNIFFLKFTTYSRRPTKTERKPTRAHSSQRRPTQAHEEGQTAQTTPDASFGLA